MNKQEAKQHELINAWIRYALKKHRAVKVEIKHTRGEPNFRYSELPEHQMQDLISFQEGLPFVHKFDDAGYRMKPCDFIGVLGGDSFVAIRYDRFISVIWIDKYIKEKEKGERSLSQERARAIAYSIIEI